MKTITGTPEQRIQAIFSQLHDNNEESVKNLIKCLKHDEDPIVRHEAAYTLGEKNSLLGPLALIDTIEKNKNKFVVHEAALALGNTGYEEGKNVLESLLNHSDPDIVDTAEIALQRLDMKINNKSIDDLNLPFEKIVTDLNQEKENRIQASFKLMDDGSKKAIDALIMALKQEPSPIVKHEIIFSLGEIISPIVVKNLLYEMENDNNPFVVHEACLALATLGYKESEESIKSLLDHKDLNISLTAKIAIERLNS